MKANYKLLAITFSLCVSIFYSCEQDSLMLFSAGEVPGKVTEITAESLPGAAKLTYKIPSSNDYLYAKIVYSPRPGVTRTVKSSLYERNVIIDGFANEGKYKVKIYSVGKGEVESEPVETEVSVDTPPYKAAFEDLKILRDFEGVTILFSNEYNKELGINVNSYNQYTKSYRLDKTYLSKINSDKEFKAIGYKSLPTKFAVTIYDRFGNVSDTLYADITPYKEELIDKSKFLSFPLPPELNLSPNVRTTIDNLWDDEVGKWSVGSSGFQSVSQSVIPTIGKTYSFSFDMGQKVKLSRFKVFHVHYKSVDVLVTAHDFKNHTPKVFEIYGSNDPASDGSWESWTKVGKFESIKPPGKTDAELKQIAFELGEDFIVSGAAGAYRYYRFKVYELYGTTTTLAIDELTFFGGPEN